MSINPLSSIGPMIDAGAAVARSPRAQVPQAGGPASGCDSGSDPKREIPVVRPAPQVVEIPQDEVQVQRDSQTNNIVIRYLDGSGNLILQVPSSQLLNLARSIAQTFEEQASSRAARIEATKGEGENSRAD